MDLLAALRWAGRLGLGVALLFVPILAWRRGVLLLADARRPGAGGVDPTVLAGGMIGAALARCALPQIALDYRAVFGLGGPWDRSAPAMIELLRTVLEAAPGRLAQELAADPRGNLLAWLGLAALAWLAELLAAMLAGPPRGAARLLAAELGVLLVSIYGTVWTIPLGLWLLNRLNVWILLIAILLIQDFRYGHPPLAGRLAARFWRARRRRS